MCGSRTRNIESIWTNVGFNGSRKMVEIILVKSHYKYVFALSPLHTMKGGEYNFAINDPFVDFIMLKHGNMTWYILFHQCVFHFSYITIGTFYGSAENKNFIRFYAFFQQLSDLINHYFFDIISRIFDICYRLSIATCQH